LTPEEFRRAGHAMVDWIADFRAGLADLPVGSQVDPGRVRAAIPRTPPTGTDGIEDFLADLDRIVVPGLTQVQHPRNFGWFPSNASLSSLLGDMASGGLGALGISWQSAPALTEVEEVMCDWLRQLTGLPDSWLGSIQDTASTGCLVAMLLGRERAGRHSQEGGGFQSLPAPLVVYTTAQAHSSVPKAALLAGYGRENIREVAVDPLTYGMRVDALGDEMDADIAAGRVPALVVAAVGTTATTAIDPVADIVEVASRHQAWVHVDAAMAGSAMLLPECRHLWRGAETADSISWNPHKWMGTALDTSLLYVRDVDHLVRVMSTSPSYLRSGADGQVTQYRDWGIPLGRRFRSLKLWAQIRFDGIEAIQGRLRRDLANAQWLADQVRAAPGWELVAPVPLQTVCVRHQPGAGMSGEELDRHTLAWVDAVNSSGEGYITASVLEGRWMARVSIGVEGTERTDVAALWQLMGQAAEADSGKSLV